MELIQEKSELFRKTINSFNQNKLLKFRKTTFNVCSLGNSLLKSFRELKIHSKHLKPISPKLKVLFEFFPFFSSFNKEVQTELSERSEELLEKIKNLRFGKRDSKDLKI